MRRGRSLQLLLKVKFFYFRSKVKLLVVEWNKTQEHHSKLSVPIPLAAAKIVPLLL